MVGDLLQPTHLLFVLVVALVVLGPKRLPEVGRSLGRGLRDFKVAISGEDQEPQETLPPEPSSDDTHSGHLSTEAHTAPVTSGETVPGPAASDETPPAPKPAQNTG